MNVICAMQPYLFPYLPYFQLAYAVDAFWVLDDVQYIRRGWMNRNRVLRGGKAEAITFPVAKGARSDQIAEKRLAPDFEAALAKIVQTLTHAYAHAPQRNEMLALVQSLSDHTRLLDAALDTLRQSFAAMGITTPLHCASTLNLPEALTGQARILALCHATNATTYINPIGGRALYDPAAFADQGIALRFLDGAVPTYPQTGIAGFIPGLSILDIIAQVPIETRRELIRAYTCRS